MRRDERGKKFGGGKKVSAATISQIPSLPFPSVVLFE